MRQLTRRELVILAIGAALAVVIPLYRFVLAPEINALTTLNDQIAAQTRTLVGIAPSAGRLPALQRDYAAAASRLAQTERQIPTSINISGLMGRLSTAISASGVQLVEVTFPSGTQPAASAADPIVELPFTVRLRGTFERIVSFMQLMEMPPAVAAEQSVSISGASALPSGAGASSANLEVTMSMKAFALR